MPANRFSQPAAFHTLNRKALGMHRVGKQPCEASNKMMCAVLGMLLLIAGKSEGLVIALLAIAVWMNDIQEVQKKCLFPMSQD